MKKSRFSFLTFFLLGAVLFLKITDAALEDYTTLRDIDKGTFNEYRYYMIKSYFSLKENFELRGTISKTAAESLLSNAKIGQNYLPDSLMNSNYFNDLKIAIQRGIESPNSEVYYEDIVQKLDTYIQWVNIQSLKGNIEASPQSGNAPLTVTFRGKVTDPSGTVIPSSSYIWWFDNGWIKKVVGRGQSINYTFRDEGNFTIFLDVKSNHKNAAGYTDVLPFSTRSVIGVKEKIASVILNINGFSLREADEIKFTPEEWNYGLIFDATSSTPTGGAKFTRTEWNFWNGVERKYNGSPKIERVVYSREGNYPVSMKLTTNEGKTIERKFTIAVHKPIATIQSNIDDGFIGDKFTFSTRSSVNEKNLSFTWNLIDITNDKVILTKNGSTFSYSFPDKWRYNVQLKVKDSAGNEDTDTKIIYINSRAPVADFSYTIPDPSKPNRVLLDGTKSYDPDFSDDGKLKYNWTINGEKIELDAIDSKWAIGYYTFNSVWDHSVVLEVIDPDDMNSIKQYKVKITSTLSVEFSNLPRVAQRWGIMRFSVTSPNARYFEWDFWDGEKKQSTTAKIDHTYQKSWVFTVKLVVRNSDGVTNSFSKTVYVSESDAPYAVIDMDFWGAEVPNFDTSACSGGAYIVNRTKTIYFKWGDSVNIDGTSNGLSYSWKIGNDKFVSGRDSSYKFDELGCFPIKLTVKSNNNGSTHSVNTWVKVENLKPTFTSLNIQAQSLESDPVIVNVNAVGAQDLDGVIQSYLWYYYTDSDNDPQDFRITSVPNTTFVIPKISGNYYFVVVMKDNNDGRYSSEESWENKYFISLSGDNINTPLIDFKVNKSSVFIGEESIFSVKVKNILWQDITDKSEYAWDFDGDGFYDQETTTGEVSHRFESSGTFYTKVRVKYKWMTNTRTIEMNIANVLQADFDFNAIGNTIIFFDKSSGKYDNIVWDLWDGNTIEGKKYFTYSYEDGKSTHNVLLKISEGTKVKTATKEVVRDLKAMIDEKNASGVYLVSEVPLQDGNITLESPKEKLALYIGTKVNTEYYGIDYDLDIDSDLNGTKDDDKDNKDDPSYTSAGVIEIPLNERKVQKVRVFIVNHLWEIAESQDIVITKNYIKEDDIDLTTITFDGISPEQREKVEKLKTYIQGLPQEFRLKWMKYVQQLQEEWFYANEKTKVILEFEQFIDSSKVSNAPEIIALLESLIVDGQQDQSVRNMAYTVIKNLIPKELVEYDEIIANLDQINQNPDQLEENKVLWKEILEFIKDTSLISNEDKVTIKTQLQVFIYWGVDKIPQEVIKETTKSDQKGNKVVGLLSNMVSIIGIIFGGVVLIIVWFFVWFKLANKNKNQGLQDFIIEKTSSKTSDVLNDLPSSNPEKKSSLDPLGSMVTREVVPEEAPKEETSLPEEPLSWEQNIPSWLQPTQTPEPVSTVVEENQVEVTPLGENEWWVPSWLKGTPVFWEDEGNATEKEEAKDLEEPQPEIIQEEGVDGVDEKKPIDFWVADIITENNIVETKLEEEKIPDWLKWVISEEKLTSDPEPQPEVPVEIPSVPQENLWEEKIVEEKKVSSTKSKKEGKEGKQDTKSVVKVSKTPAKEKTSQKLDEEKLWEDGMDIPDWLQWVAGTSANQEESKPKKKPKKDESDFWSLDPDDASEK